MTEDRPPSNLYNRVERLALNPKILNVSLEFQQDLLWTLLGFLSEKTTRDHIEKEVNWILDRIELEMSL